MLHIENEKVKGLLQSGLFGLEKENMRVDAQGFLAKTPHPFPDHAHIVRDFSEAQLEVNTGVQPTPADVVAELEDYNAEIQRALYNMGAQGLGDAGCAGIASAQDAEKGVTAQSNSARCAREYIWPSSNPPRLRGESDIPIAQFTGDLAQKTEYRKHLAREYGKYKMTFSGIHFNYSFAEDLLRTSFECEQASGCAASSQGNMSNKDGMSDQRNVGSKDTARGLCVADGQRVKIAAFDEYKNAIYLQVAEYAHAYGHVLTALTAASPVMDASYAKTAPDSPAATQTTPTPTSARATTPTSGSIAPRDLFAGSSSVRCSAAGYWNTFNATFNYSSVIAYADSIRKYVDSGQLAQSSELYFPVRLKPPAQNTTENLRTLGISHIELRMFDLNPLARAGIDVRDVLFAQLLLVWFAAAPAPAQLTKAQQLQATHNFKAAAKYDIDNEHIEVPNTPLIDFCAEVAEGAKKAEGAKVASENPQSNTSITVTNACTQIINAMQLFYANAPANVHECLNFQLEKLRNPNERYANRLRHNIKRTYAQDMLELAKKQQREYIT